MGNGLVRAFRKPSSNQAIIADAVKDTPRVSEPILTDASQVQDRFLCRFCGGRSCKHEDWTRQGDKSAIRGLNSNWITKDVLACQRPSSRLIREFDVIAQFQRARITAIFNLQLPGEHSLCGDGLVDGRFSYRAEEFTSAGIQFYNFGWLDMQVPALDRMMNIVHVMTDVIQQKGKVAVHCHAGFGRTGLAIACWILYVFGFTAKETIAIVRARRPRCIQTSKQQDFVTLFSDYVSALRTVFVIPPCITARNTVFGDVAASPSPGLNQWFTLKDAIVRQSRYLHGAEATRRRLVPKVSIPSIIAFGA